jgi:predicted CxxxxCH...CXXCH cytochrome family protein
MSSIKPSHVLLLSALLALAMGGCGDRNNKAVFSPEGGHSSDWVSTHKTSARANVESCAECHGENYDGGVSNVSCMSQSAVSGFTCHASSPAANLTGCVSCHGVSPNGPFGTAAPNRKRAHTKHTALTGCTTCHLNAGSGTLGHARANAAGGRNSATVTSSASFPFVYNANETCSNASCHGGKVTPAWSGSNDITANDNSVCLTCHEQGTAAGVPQYNSFYSGSYSGTDPATNTHMSHLGRGAFCTDCHNIGALTDYQKHFGGISSKTFTAPGNTIGGSPTKIGTYTASSKTCGSFSAGCHVNLRNWIQ